MLEDMKIFHKTYEMVKWLHTLLNKFPKSEKWTLGQKIENTGLNVMEGVIQSNNEFDKTKALQYTIVELDKLRIYFRLAKDFQFISTQQYEYASKLVNEIGRMLGGWYKKFAVGGGKIDSIFNKNGPFFKGLGWIEIRLRPGGYPRRQLGQWCQCWPVLCELEQRTVECEPEHRLPLLQHPPGQILYLCEDIGQHEAGPSIQSQVSPKYGGTEYKTNGRAASSCVEPCFPILW
ncbi:MAG: hypothetical protein COZ52_01030 [Candidatus Aenigmarchaeota archaeon CG_4_8_14_3_um_filter_37_24]|nr:MAG: hypothetical protein COZ52_01030 [Candidatus Aenigmarchaeota archaeon CG_4_8_14_3_um_filter_37_24]